MKKLISLMLALAMCFTLLTACGGSGDSGSNDNNNNNNSSNTGSGNDANSGNNDNNGGGAPADSGVSADGSKHNFVVVNHDASTSMGELYIETLCGQIAERSNGRVTFDFFPGGSLCAGPESINYVKDGSADICWATTAMYGGVFPVAEFINLPANGIGSAQLGTAVYNTMIEEIPEAAKELEGWHILAAHACTWAPICTVGKKIETPADFQGMQIRAAGTIPSMYINALGANAISMPTSDVYESISKNVIDGMANDWHNIDCFNLFEPIDYCLNTPVNETACYVMMNKDAYNSMDDDLKALFDRFSETGYASEMAGYWWDSCNFWVADKMKENGVEVYEPSAELSAFMYSDEIMNKVAQEYINYLNGFGLDGQGLYDKCTEIVNRLAPDYADVFATPFHYNDWDLNAVDNGFQASWMS